MASMAGWTREERTRRGLERNGMSMSYESFLLLSRERMSREESATLQHTIIMD